MAAPYLGRTFHRGREASLRNRPVSLSGLLAAACLVASPAAAQQAQPTSGPTPGMRYLTWAGKPEAPARPQPTPVAAAGDGLRRSGSIITRRPVVAASTPAAAEPAPSRTSRYSSASSNGLTPASEWIAPRSTVSAGANTAAPYGSASLPRVEATAPVYAPPSPRPQPMPVLPAAEAEAEPPTAAFDPMAPRPDALIYRMQGARPTDQAATTPSSPAPSSSSLAPATPYALAEQGRDGARYYSVHRAAGHQPDRTAMPEAVYLDTAPIDLAEPPPTPVVPRTVNGRAQVIVPNEDPSLP